MAKKETDETPSSREYDVGYGKPPRATRFPKGQSGNPRGRPKRSRNTSTLLAKAFNELIVVNENGKRRRITKREAMVKQLVTKAAAGDFRWARLAYDEVGKIEAKLEASRLKAKELDDQAEEELQCAVIRQLSYEERREHLDLLERAQKLVELAWDRYEKKGLT